MGQIVTDVVNFAAITSGLYPPSGSFIIGIDSADGLLKTMDSNGTLHHVGLTVPVNHFASVGNSGTGETVLYSDLIGGGLLSTDGNSLDITYGGTFGGGDPGENLTLKFRIGATGTVMDTAVFDSGSISAGSTTDWNLRVSVVRDSSSTSRVSCVFTRSVTGSAGTLIEIYATPSVTWASNSYVTITGQSSTASNHMYATMAKGVIIP